MMNSYEEKEQQCAVNMSSIVEKVDSLVFHDDVNRNKNGIFQPIPKSSEYFSGNSDDLLSSSSKNERFSQKLSGFGCFEQCENTDEDSQFKPVPNQNQTLFKISKKELAGRINIMLDNELKWLPLYNYIEEVQEDGMHRLWRSKISCWLLEFEEEYSMSQETIAVAVNFTDRYLSKKSVKLEHIQLLAMTSIFIASKQHETVPLSIRDVSNLADGCYSLNDIKATELDLLSTISWDLNPVTAQALMSHLLEYVECPEEKFVIYEDALTFLDIVIPEYDFLAFIPSEQAVAALLCAFDTTGISSKQWFSAINNAKLNKDLFKNYGGVYACKKKMLEFFYEMCPDISPQQQRTESPNEAFSQYEEQKRQQEELDQRTSFKHGGCILRNSKNHNVEEDEIPIFIQEQPQI